MNITKSSAFTLIELLVVTSIMGILFSLGFAQYQNFNRIQILKQAALNLKNDLRDVQNRALSGEKDCGVNICGGPILGCGNDPSGEKPLNNWNVTFTSSPPSYVIAGDCGGTSFSPKTVTLPNILTLTPPSSNPIKFKPTTGGIDNPVTQTICIGGFNKIYRLKVTISGDIEDDGIVPSC